MTTTDYSREWSEKQPPDGLKTSTPTLPSFPSSQQQKPLRHGIDAILHKATSLSNSTTHNWTPKPTLPHIETLRRTPVPGMSTSLFGWSMSGGDVISPTCEEDGESGADPSSHSSADSSDEQEDVVIVDDTNEAVSIEDNSTEEQSQDPDPKDHTTTLPASKQHILARGGLAQCPALSPHNEQVWSACTAFGANVSSRAEVIKDSFEKVKSAFRPIVRPWLFENGCPRLCANDLMIKVPESRDHFRSVGGLQTRNTEFSLRSLDAISMLRKQSTVFRAACNNSRPQVHKNQAITAITSPAMENGQPLPSSLTSWFSWLRSGRLHLNPHAPPQQLTPGASPPCRFLVPSSGISASLPSQAPRYNCDACGKSYSTFGGLSKHKQFHCAAQIKKDFRCKFCDKSYSSLGALKMHIRTHTLPCKCTVCGKAFSRPWLLQGHLRTHTGEKPFSCPHCARAFADRSNLRAHLQTHSDVKKYSCRHCSKTFSRMSLLAKHQESSCLGLHS
ncbi:uncharacterized protein LOC143285716 [Babylonia areolata]|uniref:uncharacterized protein LOC143285716 n=1 Tax=Babylonia areolata TaxID=304850 RepID=UPI003FCF4CAB